MVYGYARVSTIKQTQGNSLEEQKKQLQEAGAQIIIEEICTGTKIDRPLFSKLISDVVPGDTIIITKLDRFARTAIEGAALVRGLVDRGIDVYILNIGRANNTSMGKLIVTIMSAFAEYERDMIIERTQAGKSLARAKGQRVDGRPKKYSKAQLDHAMDLLKENSYSYTEKVTGISKSTLIREKTRRGQEEERKKSRKIKRQ